MTWNGRDFARIMSELTDDCPIALEYEAKYLTRRGWWKHQREHLCAWFYQLGTPGAYGRKSRDMTARGAYNRFQCAPGLLWLAEALGESTAVVAAAAEAAGGVGRPATQCAAIRRVIPWRRIEELAKQAEIEILKLHEKEGRGWLLI